MTNEKLKRTSLYDTHIKYGGKMVPFAGWEMPIQYASGVISEHMAVRTACGIFDVSHMGEISVTGEDAEKFLNYILTNDFSGMLNGMARYSLMCNDDGGIIDDLITYRINENNFLMVVNAANTAKDMKWISSHIKCDVTIKDISSKIGQIALQGPNSLDVLKCIMDPTSIPEEYYCANYDVDVAGVKSIVSKTGYTGEEGVEIYMPFDKAPVIWEALMDAGKDTGLIPCGLGARDTLRLEAGMPLYGHEMNEDITPREALLSIFVNMDKNDFIGKAAIEAKTPPMRRKVGLEVVDRGIIRENMEVYRDGNKIGYVTSGTMCPYLKKALGCAMIKADAFELGKDVEVDVRGRMVKARMIKSQFYKRTER